MFQAYKKIIGIKYQTSYCANFFTYFDINLFSIEDIFEIIDISNISELQGLTVIEYINGYCYPVINPFMISENFSSTQKSEMVKKIMNFNNIRIDKNILVEKNVIFYYIFCYKNRYENNYDFNEKTKNFIISLRNFLTDYYEYYDEFHEIEYLKKHNEF